MYYILLHFHTKCRNKSCYVNVKFIIDYALSRDPNITFRLGGLWKYATYFIIGVYLCCTNM